MVLDEPLSVVQEDDLNAAAAALEANYPDMMKKNKRRKAGSAVIPALAEAGRHLVETIPDMLQLAIAHCMYVACNGCTM